MLVTYLSLAVVLGLVVDRTRTGRAATAGARARGRRAGGGPRPWPAWPWPRLPLVPVASYLSPTVPMVTQPVRPPTWFTTVAPRLPDTRCSWCSRCRTR